jgi:hypothetical protein
MERRFVAFCRQIMCDAISIARWPGGFAIRQVHVSAWNISLRSFEIGRVNGIFSGSADAGHFDGRGDNNPD